MSVSERSSVRVDESVPAVLPRSVPRSTVLVDDGRAVCAIVYPDTDSAYRPLAELLARAIGVRCGTPPRVVTDVEIVPRRNTPLPAVARQQTLLLLGNLTNNRLIAPLYARFYCADDATYPGGDGYDLRTLPDPFGTGANWILVGGSSWRGVQRGVERLLRAIDEVAEPGRVELPFLLELDLDQGLAAGLTRAVAPIDLATLPTTNSELLRLIGTLGIAYAWTGRDDLGRYAGDCLRVLNDRFAESYGDWHYSIERLVRALPWLSAGGFVSADDLWRTEQRLLTTAIETAAMWWRKRDGQPPLGHRHHGKGTYAFGLQARYLLEQARLNRPARELCQGWLDESRAFLDALAVARADDQDDESSLNNLSTLIWYALGEERYEFFESGNARRCAERAIAIHDNLGAGAGIGGYGEALSGAMYLQQEAGTMVAATAFYHDDAELTWALDRLPHLRLPIRADAWSLSPVFMHKFDVGPANPSVVPTRLTGLRRIALGPYRVRITADPPEHVEPRGHSVNAAETWLLSAGVGKHSLLEERTFDKIVFRPGFAREDPYLLLQGWQGGWRWQGSMDAANAIVRFAQGGHIFLIQNSDRQSYYHKNALFVSDGDNVAPLPPVAEWLALDDLPRLATSVTRLAPYSHTAWTRYVFARRSEPTGFVVVDVAQIQRDGAYSFTSTWRTPGYAELHGRHWHADQGDQRFTLVSSQDHAAECVEEEPEGAAHPFALRRRQAGTYQAGDLVSFQTLFWVQPVDSTTDLDLIALDSTRCLLRRDTGEPVAAYLVNPDGRESVLFGLVTDALGVSLEATAIHGSGLRNLRVDAELPVSIEASRPVGVELDLAGRTGRVTLDGPGGEPARVRVQCGALALDVVVTSAGPYELRLPLEVCAALQEHARSWLADAVPAAATVPLDSTSTALGSHESGWRFAAWTLRPERLRAITVQVSPEPTNGFPEQLIDTMLPEWRTPVETWPPGQAIDVTLRLARTTDVDEIRIIGDSLVQPTLQTFRTLPDGIRVEVSSVGSETNLGQAAPPIREEYAYPRYHGFRDRFEAARYPIRAAARKLRVRVPAPTDGGPLVLHEIEIYAQRHVAPPVARLLTVDLDRDGRAEVIAVNRADELVVLRADGTPLWRWQAPGQVTHLSTQDLDGDGRRQVCVGAIGGHLFIFDPDGSLRNDWSFAEFNQTATSLFFGFFHTVHGLAVWHRDAAGRAALVIGAYALLVFLDPDGRVLGHSWADGAWQTDVLALPGAAGASRDLWSRNRWNHGICTYEGWPASEPRGGEVSFGGVRQPMFRSIRRVIPFVTGGTLAFTAIDVVSPVGGLVLVAADHGVGVLHRDAEDWLWKIEGGTPLRACAVVDADGDGIVEVARGGADGFVSALDLRTGQVKRRRDVGAPIVGLATVADGRLLVVGTRRELLVLDQDWTVVRRESRSVRHVAALDPATIVVAADDGRLEQIGIDPDRRQRA